MARGRLAATTRIGLCYRNRCESVLIAAAMAAAGRCIETSIRTVVLVVGSGGKKQCVDRLVGDAVSKSNAPQAVDLDRLVVAAFELAQRFVGARIKGVDATIAEIADRQSIAELAETGCSVQRIPSASDAHDAA
jgi:hypothetical protein